MTIWAQGAGQGAGRVCLGAASQSQCSRPGLEPFGQGNVGAVCCRSVSSLVVTRVPGLGVPARAQWASRARFCVPPCTWRTVRLLPCVLPVTLNGDVGYTFDPRPVRSLVDYLWTFPVFPCAKWVWGDIGFQFAFP